MFQDWRPACFPAGDENRNMGIGGEATNATPTALQSNWREGRAGGGSSESCVAAWHESVTAERGIDDQGVQSVGGSD